MSLRKTLLILVQKRLSPARNPCRKQAHRQTSRTLVSLLGRGLAEGGRCVLYEILAVSSAEMSARNHPSRYGERAAHHAGPADAALAADPTHRGR